MSDVRVRKDPKLKRNPAAAAETESKLRQKPGADAVTDLNLKQDPAVVAETNARPKPEPAAVTDLSLKQDPAVVAVTDLSLKQDPAVVAETNARPKPEPDAAAVTDLNPKQDPAVDAVTELSAAAEETRSSVVVRTGVTETAGGVREKTIPSRRTLWQWRTPRTRNGESCSARRKPSVTALFSASLIFLSTLPANRADKHSHTGNQTENSNKGNG